MLSCTTRKSHMPATAPCPGFTLGKGILYLTFLEPRPVASAIVFGLFCVIPVTACRALHELLHQIPVQCRERTAAIAVAATTTTSVLVDKHNGRILAKPLMYNEPQSQQIVAIAEVMQLQFISDLVPVKLVVLLAGDGTLIRASACLPSSQQGVMPAVNSPTRSQCRGLSLVALQASVLAPAGHLPTGASCTSCCCC